MYPVGRCSQPDGESVGRNGASWFCGQQGDLWHIAAGLGPRIGKKLWHPHLCRLESTSGSTTWM